MSRARRRREQLRRRAFLAGVRAGSRRPIREVLDDELRRFNGELDRLHKQFEDGLAASSRASLHRLRGPEDVAVDPPRWLQ